jgi:hypothetical protein
MYLKLRGFSWKHGINNFAPVGTRLVSQSLNEENGPDLPKPLTYILSPGLPTPGLPSLLRPPIAVHVGSGILT